jgi:hypothetical protein
MQPSWQRILQHPNPYPPQLYHDMLSRGIEPTAATFGALLTLASEVGAWGRVVQTWAWLQASGLPVHVGCANTYLGALLKLVSQRVRACERACACVCMPACSHACRPRERVHACVRARTRGCCLTAKLRGAGRSKRHLTGGYVCGGWARRTGLRAPHSLTRVHSAFGISPLITPHITSRRPHLTSPPATPCLFCRATGRPPCRFLPA